MRTLLFLLHLLIASAVILEVSYITFSRFVGSRWRTTMFIWWNGCWTQAANFRQCYKRWKAWYSLLRMFIHFIIWFYRYNLSVVTKFWLIEIWAQILLTPIFTEYFIDNQIYQLIRRILTLKFPISLNTCFVLTTIRISSRITWNS